MNSVAIIGGGITGLTAAFRLQQQDIPITLYEASNRVGGPIQSVCYGGYLAECGPNTILETSTDISKLVRDLSLESRRLYSDPFARNRYIAKDARPVPLPDSLGKFLATPLFSLSAKLRLALEPFIGRLRPGAEESVADFVLRRLGKEFLDYAINPFVAGVYAGDPAHLSVIHAFPKLHAVEQRYGSLILGQFLGARERKRRGEVSKQNAPKFSFDDGLEVLTDTLRENLGNAVRLKERVKRLRRIDQGWALTVRSGHSEMEEEHSAVLLALGAHQLAELRIDAAGMPRLTQLSDIHHPPVASVVLGFRREDVLHPLDGFGVLIPRTEGMHILGTIFSSSLFPSRAPAGHVTLTSYIGGRRAPELALKNADALVNYALTDLRKLLGVSGAPTFRHCFTFPRAIPQYDVGYGRFKELMNHAEAAAPGLFIGGHCRHGPSIGDSIVSGTEAAAKIRDHLAIRKENKLPHSQLIYA